jgi:hypothetical protein
VSLSLGVHAAETTRTLPQNQVMPLGAPEAGTETQADSETSEFDSEADSEAQPLAAAATEKASAS